MKISPGWTAQAVASLLPLVLLLAACGGAGASGSVSAGDGEARLRAAVLQPADLGEGYTLDRDLVLTNEEAAAARPDAENARRQYAGWRQVIQYNVQYAAPPDAQLVFNGKIARLMNTATFFQTAGGASASLAYTRGLSASVAANFLVNESVGTQISDTQVTKEIEFPAKGDESFAWRVSGKATFENGFVATFVADTVFVRTGRITGNVTAVALGEAPQRQELEQIVDTFVARARRKG